MVDVVDKLLGSASTSAAQDPITELLDEGESPHEYDDMSEFLALHPSRKRQPATHEFVDAWFQSLDVPFRHLSALGSQIREDIAELPGRGTAVLSVLAVGVSVLSALAVHRHLSRIERRLPQPLERMRVATINIPAPAPSRTRSPSPFPPPTTRRDP